MFANIDRLTPRRIRSKLNEGHSLTETAVWFASNAITRVLDTYTAEALDEFVNEVHGQLILTTEEKSAIILDLLNNAKSSGLDKLCACLQKKGNDDIREFISMLFERPSLTSLADYIDAVIRKCEHTNGEISGDRNTETRENHFELTLTVQVPGNDEDFVLKKLEAENSFFEDEVLHIQGKVTLVKRQSILIVVTVQDQWDIENIRCDISSGIFHRRFMLWLRNAGLDLTNDEEEYVTAEITETKEVEEFTREDNNTSQHIAPMDDSNYLQCGTTCELTEEKINSFNIDEYNEILDLLEAHNLDPDDVDDVAEGQVLLRQHVQQKIAEANKNKEQLPDTLTHDVIGSLVREHHKRRRLLLESAKTVLGFVSRLPPARSKELNRYFPQLEKELQTKITELEEEKCLFIVAGESGSGKSGLINLLMNQTEQEFLPVSTLPSTSCMCDISYGETAKITAYSSDSASSAPVVEDLTVDNVAEKLSHFTHQKLDRAKIKYKKVEVQWPCEWLEGINLVDTPGVGENDEMTALVKEMMPKAVGFIYVINTQKAGGIQPEELEDLLLQQIQFQEGSRSPGEVFDPSTAIFVFNKWDTIDSDEKEKVKAFVLNKLKMVWSELEPDKQMFFVSVKQAQKSMQSGVVPKDYCNMLKGIETMIDLSLRSNMKRHYGYLTAVLERCKYILLMYLNSYPNMKEEYEIAKKKLKGLSSKTKVVRDKIKETFKRETDNIVIKMKAHLEDEDVRTRLSTWPKAECPTNKDIQRAAKAMSQVKVYEEIKLWEAEHQIFAAVHKSMLNIFQEHFVSLKNDLTAIEGSLLKNKNAKVKQWLRNVGTNENDSAVFKMVKRVLKGVTIGILTGFIGLAGWGIYEGVSAVVKYIQKQQEEMKHYKEYKSGKIGLQELMRRETLTVIKGICSGPNLQASVEENLGDLVVTMNAMLQVIPEFVEADRALLVDMQKQLEEGLKPEVVHECNKLQANVMNLQGILDYCYLLHIEKEDVPLCKLSIKKESRLGGGTFGDVYKAIWQLNETESKEVAVKIIKEGISCDNSTEIRTEIQFLRTMSSENSNMVQYFGMSLDERDNPDEPGRKIQVPCFLLEICHTSLDKVIYNRTKYDPPGRMVAEGILKERAVKRMANFAMQIANGLVAMHKYDLVHRDLKPANILVKLLPDSGPTDQTEILKLCDFGFTKSEEYITNSDVGTILYMAPQVLNKEHYGKEADMFSYGITVLELYYGTVAYRLEFVRVKLQPTMFVGDPFELNKPSQDWVDIISSSWSEEPCKRPTSLDCFNFFKAQQNGTAV